MQEGNGSPAPAVSPRSAKTAGRDATPQCGRTAKALPYVYAKHGRSARQLLPGLIEQMKAEIKAIKESRNLDAIPDGISEKKKAIAAYMREHPEVTSKSAIAKAVGTDRNTVRKYYDEIRSELGLK